MNLCKTELLRIQGEVFLKFIPKFNRIYWWSSIILFKDTGCKIIRPRASNFYQFIGTNDLYLQIKELFYYIQQVILGREHCSNSSSCLVVN